MLKSMRLHLGNIIMSVFSLFHDNMLMCRYLFADAFIDSQVKSFSLKIHFHFFFLF